MTPFVMEEMIEQTFVSMIIMSRNSSDCLSDWPKIIWPKYSPLRRGGQSGDETVKRFSEQELKQKFLEVLIREKYNVYYSVETPTMDGYYFSGKSPVIKHHADGGQSGNFDLTIYHKSDIGNHIEFKSDNPETNSISKDLLKLSNEPYCNEVHSQLCNEDSSYSESCKNCNDYKGVENYYIHIVDSFNEKTKISLNDKFLNSEVKNEINKSLEYSKNQIYVYILVLNNLIQSNTQGYYKFKFVDCSSNQRIEKIDWDNSWHPYDDIHCVF